MTSFDDKMAAVQLSLVAVPLALLGGYVLVNACQQKSEDSFAKEEAVRMLPSLESPPEETVVPYFEKYDENGCLKEKEANFVPWKSEKELNDARASFIKRSYRRIAEEQSSRFHLEHFNVPQYVLEYSKQGSGIPRDAGVYDYETDIITFGLSLGKPGGWNEDLYGAYNCWGISKTSMESSADYNIRHELGHAYFHALAKRLKVMSWFQENEHNYESQETLAQDMIMEGFAEYVASYGNSTEERTACVDPLFERPSSYDWQTADERKTGFMEHHSYIYGCGFTLVEPILHIDFKEGLEYLLTHPPTQNDLKDLRAYQARAREAIQ